MSDIVIFLSIENRQYRVYRFYKKAEAFVLASFHPAFFKSQSNKSSEHLDRFTLLCYNEDQDCVKPVFYA